MSEKDIDKLIMMESDPEGAIHETYLKLKIAEAKLKLVEDLVNDWLSEAHGNSEWIERFYYATGLEPPEWLDKWTEEYVEKHQYYFRRWLDEEKEKLCIKEVELDE